MLPPVLPPLEDAPPLQATPSIARTIAAATSAWVRRNLPAIDRLPEEPHSLRMPSPPQLRCPARIRAGNVLSHNNRWEARNPGS